MRVAMFPKLALAGLLALAPVAGAKDVEVAAFLHDNFHILPETIHAEPGDVLRIQVTNQGVVPHDLFFCGDGGLAAPPHSCSRPLGGPVAPQPEQTLPLTVTVPAAGTYWYYCTIAGHAAQGMAGTLVVAGEPTETRESPGAGLALVALALVAAVGFGRWRA